MEENEIVEMSEKTENISKSNFGKYFLRISVALIIIGFVWWNLGEWHELYIPNARLPYYEVSLDKLKKDLENEQMLVPDISFELPENVICNIGIERGRWGKIEKRISYSLYNLTPIGTPEFEEIQVMSILYWNSREIRYNTNLFGIKVEEYIQDFSEEKEYLSGRGLPEGTFAAIYRYKFSYQGFLYLVEKTLALSPESLKEKDIETEKVRVKSEMQSLVKSIIDKGEKER